MNDQSLHQEYEHNFIATKSETLNAIGCFIWVDLGFGDPATRKKGLKFAQKVSTEQFPCKFPFGDSRLTAASNLNSFCSLLSQTSVEYDTYATNWMNPIVLLPSPIKVEQGNKIKVRTIAKLSTVQPSYQFDVSVGDTKTSIELTFQDLYPDFMELDPESK